MLVLRGQYGWAFREIEVKVNFAFVLNSVVTVTKFHSVSIFTVRFLGMIFITQVWY